MGGVDVGIGINISHIIAKAFSGALLSCCLIKYRDLCYEFWGAFYHGCWHLLSHYYLCAFGKTAAGTTNLFCVCSSHGADGRRRLLWSGNLLAS
jgi:hypothetical protein